MIIKDVISTNYFDIQDATSQIITKALTLHSAPLSEFDLSNSNYYFLE